eukprot:CAMPEP_0170310108 /NCGR_PEP_ID=MMETSP0116_2-20130129/55532_1 /TAXON_ID=400756 /ORGANISM="Durinskia baltica, Strain CSIRO CS-38" /LENGTH=35 /DNA_ID= /DNA_START= /DNA_END= /DNA_ORIENTATION=
MPSFIKKRRPVESNSFLAFLLVVALAVQNIHGFSV